MAVSDWISRLFSSGNAQGLSGESAGLEPGAPWFDGRLQRHRAGGDMIADPTLIWQPTSGTGLAAHLRARTRDNPADFTDVLIVVNSADWSKSLNQLQEPWADTAARALDTQFDQLSREASFPLLFASRGLCFHVIADGGPEMAGENYNLDPGEFVTGLLPNHYTAPSPTSRPVVAVHLNLPDVWEGYKEVGRLHSDQVSFTLGNHWLDSYSHFTLKEPGLYRLQQYLDGSFVHIIDPDLQARYSVVSNQEAGANVLTLMDANGEVIAHLILALMDSIVQEDPSPPSSAASLPGIALPTPVVAEPTPSFIGNGSLESLGHKTIVPESVQEQIFTLKERGALLQKVHFHKFMRGYDVYVSGNGNLTTRTMDRAATFQVRANQVSLVVHKPEVRVDGAATPLETPQPVRGNLSLQVGPHLLEYRDLSNIVQEPGWPYLGEILRPATSTHMVFGGTYGIGRDRRNKVQLPDEPHNDNIAWLDNSNSGVIRARSGEIRKSQFYTDSIMVASKHAEIDLANEPALTSIAKHCYSYVRREGRVHSLVPTKQDGDRTMVLQSGDEILVGNCLFSVSYGSETGTTPPKAVPPPPKLTAESLAKAADGDTWADSVEESTSDRERRRAQRRGKPPASLIDEILNSRSNAGDTRGPESQRKPQPNTATPSLDALLNARKPPQTTDLPAAAGLGEEGLPPRQPRITSHGYDSLMGLEVSRPDVLELDETPEPSATFQEPQAFSQEPPAISQEPLQARVPAPIQESGYITDESGVLYGLPGPTAPRQDFDVMGDEAETHERLVQVESTERDGALLDGNTFDDSYDDSFDDHGLQEDQVEETGDPATDLPGPSVLSPPGVQDFVAELRQQIAELRQEEDKAPASLQVPKVASSAPKQTTQATFIPEYTGVAIVDEDEIQLQLARPARLLHIGWALSGEVTIGNHYGCDVVVPENRMEAHQVFEEQTYCSLRIRGHRGKIELLSEYQARLSQNGESISKGKGLDDVLIEIIRRDEDGDEDFAVLLALDPTTEVPDPRGRLLAIDLSDRIVASLFTQGLPLGTDHRVRMGPIVATLHFDGSGAKMMDYLESYQLGPGRFAPFFLRKAGQRFQTVPEDGRPIQLEPGDELMAGVAVYRFEMR
ncbi:MAG: hypothetical protein ACI9VR_002543 [Cognaticolwellia sp.]|jgi:hypothetical protein